MNRGLKIAVTVAVIVVLVAAFFVYDTTLKGSAPPNGTITVRDSLGRNVTFNHTLTRIVSIDPSATATLYALGGYHDLVGGSILEIGCGPGFFTLPLVKLQNGRDNDAWRSDRNSEKRVTDQSVDEPVSSCDQSERELIVQSGQKLTLRQTRL